MALDGYAMARNLPDLRELPLDRFCSLVYYWATRHAEQESDVRKFEARLWRPPPRTEITRGPWTPEAETSAFAALKQALSKG